MDPQVLFVAGDTNEYKQHHIVHMIIKGLDGINRADTRYFRDADTADRFIKSTRKLITTTP